GIRDATVTGVQTCALPISTGHQPTNSVCAVQEVNRPERFFDFAESCEFRAAEGKRREIAFVCGCKLGPVDCTGRCLERGAPFPEVSASKGCFLRHCAGLHR